MKTEMEKQSDLIKKFNVHHHWYWTVSRNSREYQYYEHSLNELQKAGKVRFITRKRNVVTYALTHCYPSETGIKKHCVVQCEACKLLQQAKETITEKVTNEIEDYQIKKIKNPSKIQQIIKIIFKK